MTISVNSFFLKTSTHHYSFFTEKGNVTNYTTRLLLLLKAGRPIDSIVWL